MKLWKRRGDYCRVVEAFLGTGRIERRIFQSSYRRHDGPAPATFPPKPPMRVHGATVARLTPDQTVGRSNRSGLIFRRLSSAPRTLRILNTVYFEGKSKNWTTVNLSGFEPAAISGKTYRKLDVEKWTRRGSNPRPSACKADVIPLHHEPAMQLHFTTNTVL
jgi:hypothetical protein